jgi:raffinose synthase
MFTSLSEAAGLHAAARAIGGCPIYVSDAPGQHDGALLRKLVLPDGAILRADGVARPTRDCLFADVTADGVSALKLWNRNGRPTRYGTGAAACPPNAVLGAFNVQGSRWDFATHGTVSDPTTPPPVSALVRPSDAECLRPHSGPFAVWSHRGGRLQLLPGLDAFAHATLQHREWDVFTVAPVHARGHVQWAPLGLVEMLNGGGAVLWTSLGRSSADRGVAEARVASRAAGRFVAYCQPRPQSVWREGAELSLPFAYDGATGVLTVQLDRATAQKPATLVVQW